jgi:molybdopterin converting factor small subunit
VRVHFLFFAQARERAGQSRATVDLPEGARVRDALAAIESIHPGLRELRPHLAVALDQRLAGEGDAVSDGAEIALLPPVSGGAAAPTLRVVPATAERWDDLERLFGPRGACAGCWCMYPRLRGAEFRQGSGEGNRRRLRALVKKGPPPGLIGYDRDEPVAWCALAPREDYPRLEHSRTLARVDQAPVWSVVCFFVAKGHRRRGLTVVMLEHAARWARSQGARMLEGYPVDPKSGKTADAFAWWGVADAFRAAGFREVERRSPTHPIMRRTLKAAARASRG